MLGRETASSGPMPAPSPGPGGFDPIPPPRDRLLQGLRRDRLARVGDQFPSRLDRGGDPLRVVGEDLHLALTHPRVLARLLREEVVVHRAPRAPLAYPQRM